MKLVNVLSGDVVKVSNDLEELKMLGVSIALNDGVNDPHWDADDTTSHLISRHKAICLNDEEGTLFRIFLTK